jgi:LPXTG-motif cell wall-anchored protein
VRSRPSVEPKCEQSVAIEVVRRTQRQALKEILSDWHEWLPLAGIALLALVGVVLWLRRKPEDENDIERQRRAYLNRVGRIVEGQVLEVVDHHPGEAHDPYAKQPKMFQKRPPAATPNGTQKLLYYTYSISGVTYETAQDITGLEEAAHLSRIAAGQTASVKYDPSNPSNSILLADDWSGLH